MGDVDCAPIIIFHSLAHAVAALMAARRAGRRVVLGSAPDAGAYVGPGWFGALIAEARASVPEAQSAALLDCGDHVGAALAAIRAGVEAVIFTGRPDVASRLADIARQHGVRLDTERPTGALDLGTEFFASQDTLGKRCAEFLG